MKQSWVPPRVWKHALWRTGSESCHVFVLLPSPASSAPRSRWPLLLASPPHAGATCSGADAIGNAGGQPRLGGRLRT
eukprot:9500350-Pyramimonas_sp.AAC.1